MSRILFITIIVSVLYSFVESKCDVCGTSTIFTTTTSKEYTCSNGQLVENTYLTSDCSGQPDNSTVVKSSCDCDSVALLTAVSYDDRDCSGNALFSANNYPEYDESGTYCLINQPGCSNFGNFSREIVECKSKSANNTVVSFDPANPCFGQCSTSIDRRGTASSFRSLCVNNTYSVQRYLEGDCGGLPFGDPISFGFDCDCNNVIFLDGIEYVNGTNCTGPVREEFVNRAFPAVGFPANLNPCDFLDGCDGTSFYSSCTLGQNISDPTKPEFDISNEVTPIMCVDDELCFGQGGSSYAVTCFGSDWIVEQHKSDDCSGQSVERQFFTSVEIGFDCVECNGTFGYVEYWEYADDNCTFVELSQKIGVKIDECIPAQGVYFLFECDANDVITVSGYSDTNCNNKVISQTEDTYRCDGSGIGQFAQCRESGVTQVPNDWCYNLCSPNGGSSIELVCEGGSFGYASYSSNDCSGTAVGLTDVQVPCSCDNVVVVDSITWTNESCSGNIESTLIDFPRVLPVGLDDPCSILDGCDGRTEYTSCTDGPSEVSEDVCFDQCSTITDGQGSTTSLKLTCGANNMFAFERYLEGDCGGPVFGDPVSLGFECDCKNVVFVDSIEYVNGTNCTGVVREESVNRAYPTIGIPSSLNPCDFLDGCDNNVFYTSCTRGEDISSGSDLEFNIQNEVSPLMCVNGELCFAQGDSSYAVSCINSDWIVEQHDSDDCSGQDVNRRFLTSAEMGFDCTPCDGTYGYVEYYKYARNDSCATWKSSQTFGITLDECIVLGGGSMMAECDAQGITLTSYTDTNCQTFEDSGIEATYACQGGASQLTECRESSTTGLGVNWCYDICTTVDGRTLELICDDGSFGYAYYSSDDCSGNPFLTVDAQVPCDCDNVVLLDQTNWSDGNCSGNSLSTIKDFPRILPVGLADPCALLDGSCDGQIEITSCTDVSAGSADSAEFDDSCYGSCGSSDGVYAELVCDAGKFIFEFYDEPECQGNLAQQQDTGVAGCDCNDWVFVDFITYENKDCTGNKLSESFNVPQSAQTGCAVLDGCDADGTFYTSCSKQPTAFAKSDSQSSSADETTTASPQSIQISDFLEPYMCINGDFCYGMNGMSASISCEGLSYKFETFNSPDCSGTIVEKVDVPSSDVGRDCPVCPDNFVDVNSKKYENADCTGSLVYDNSFGIILDECIAGVGESWFWRCEDSGDAATATLYTTSTDCKGNSNDLPTASIECSGGLKRVETCTGDDSTENGSVVVYTGIGILLSLVMLGYN